MTTLPDLDHCPNCGESLGIGPDPEPLLCAAVWPGSEHDVEPVRCRLYDHHRSDEHWHPSLWPGTPDLLWFDPPLPDEPKPRGF